jgi:hypothetical protein
MADFDLGRAKGRIEIDTSGLAKAELEAKHLDSTIGKTSSSSSAKLKKFGSAALGVGKAVAAGATVVGAAAIKNAIEAQKVGAQTTAVLKSTGGAANVTEKDIGSLSNRIMGYSGISDEAVQSNANLLLTFTNVRNEAGKNNDVFNQAVSIGADMSTALGTDMAGSAIQLGKALNDPVKGVTALTRVGVTFDEQQKAQIKTMVDSGNTLEAQKLILGELTKEFGGSAQAMGQTAAGQFNIMKEEVGNSLEQIGGQLLSVGQTALPALSKAFETTFEAIGPSLGTFAEAVGGTISEIAPVFGKIIGDIAPFIAKILDVLGPFISQLAEVLLPILEALLPALDPILKLFADLSPVIIDVVGAIAPLIQELLPPLVEILTAIEPIIAAVLGWWVKWQGFLIRLMIPVLKLVINVLAAVAKAGVAVGNFILKYFINPILWGLGKLVDALDFALGPFINFPDVPQIPEIKANVDALGDSLADTGEKAKKTGDTVDSDVTPALEHHGQVLGDIGDKYDAFGHTSDDVTKIIQANAKKTEQSAKDMEESFAKWDKGFKGALTSIQQEMNDWADGATDNLNFVDDALGTFAGKAHVNIDNVIGDFQKQRDKMSGFFGDIATILDRGGQDAQGLARALIDMGSDGVGVAESIAGANKKQFGIVVDTWNDAHSQSDNFAQQIKKAILGAMDTIGAAILIASGKADNLAEALDILGKKKPMPTVTLAGTDSVMNKIRALEQNIDQSEAQVTVNFQGLKNSFHTGGKVGGSGDVPAVLKGGEWVINPEQSKKYHDLLKMINEGHFPDKYMIHSYHQGGRVPDLDASLNFWKVIQGINEGVKDLNPYAHYGGTGVGSLTPRASAYWNFAMSVPGIVSASSGRSNRTILGTNIPSQHNYGNAVDAFSASGVPDAPKQLLADLASAAYQQMAIHYMAYNNRGFGSEHAWIAGNVTSPHTDHVHADFFPQYPLHKGGITTGYMSAFMRPREAVVPLDSMAGRKLFSGGDTYEVNVDARGAQRGAGPEIAEAIVTKLEEDRVRRSRVAGARGIR